MFFRIQYAPCLRKKCRNYTKDDEKTYIIGISCLSCRFFAKQNNFIMEKK